MIDLNVIEQTLSSQLPPSMERAAEILKKSLTFYQELKKQFLLGSPEEKAQALKTARLIFGRIDVEISQICEALGLRMETLKKQIVAYFSPLDAAQYIEATEFISAHQNELAPPIKRKAVLKIPKLKISRRYC